MFNDGFFCIFASKCPRWMYVALCMRMGTNESFIDFWLVENSHTSEAQGESFPSAKRSNHENRWSRSGIEDHRNRFVLIWVWFSVQKPIVDRFLRQMKKDYRISIQAHRVKNSSGAWAELGWIAGYERLAILFVSWAEFNGTSVHYACGSICQWNSCKSSHLWSQNLEIYWRILFQYSSMMSHYSP